ncbi:extracellular catalytic domain type 1 short-chain-length polyhydroxyalkanoate depolymerase [Coralloluteibacterium stylophorae]|uniref:Polyhydroxybutyrate depolymerase n=1 Tax=Coralloluteibacterium stylophorae TaxID=1776034 RepID=A0A8J8AWU3_9GAMM|nr:PHB depolymerase family esterase [Coralloluteibacterium stylophorae]MBS7456945.1 hypothetical protein [Coralloluteibacterium stylophorae]
MPALFRITILLLLLAACCAPACAAGAPAAAIADAPAPARAFAGAAGLGSGRIAVDGTTRSYSLFVPPRASAPVPLVIALHGGGGNGRVMAVDSGLERVAAQQGFVVAFPDGLGPRPGFGTWNAGGCCGWALRHGVDDVGFVRALIDELQRTQRIDPARIYVVGMSNGGMLAQRIGIEMPERIAAVAAVVGALFADAPPPPAALPVLMINAVDDDIVPWAGGWSPTGFVARSQDRPFLSAPEALALWARADGCAGAPEVSETAAWRLQRYAHCRGGSEVALYAFAAAGHGWPGEGPGITRRSGKRPVAFATADTVWAFFARHRRPPPRVQAGARASSTLMRRNQASVSE